MVQLPRTVVRPRPRRRSSTTARSTDSESEGETSGPIPHQDVYVDDRLPSQYFKQDVIRLIHALRIPRWSSVTEKMAEDLVLERISGALTNSVYSVEAPEYVKEMLRQGAESRSSYYHRLPPRLLLRVYGPQVEMLIDRKKELDTIAQLTRQKIGAKLLGTFANGRFEQFLNAKPLTRHDLRNTETSILIAKRMRDLHDNVAVSSNQRAEGPYVWSAIEKWEHPARAKLELLDKVSPEMSIYILGTDFERFISALTVFRGWLEEKLGGAEAVKNRLVFAHNDTQYGNILRVEPPPGSPLLRPQNEHRQLVVIDFEYSGQNARAFDIANHFCEWMSDYHHPSMSYHIWTDRYPNKDEQLRFINSYVEHGSATFDEAAMDQEAETLFNDVSLWRPAVSAYWALWGIVQAPLESDVLKREDLLRRTAGYDFAVASPLKPTEAPEVEDDSFNYIEYAKEKVSIFWQDLQNLGVNLPAA